MIGLLLTIVLVGAVLYLIENYIPMSPPLKTLLRVVVVIFVILWLVQIFGIDTRLPRLR